MSYHSILPLRDFDLNTINIELEVEDYGNYAKLELLFIPRCIQNRGYGTTIMKKIIKEADRNGQIVVLQTCNKWGKSKKYLKCFYGKFGFVERKKNKRRKTRYFQNCDMYRMPQRIEKEEK